MSDLDKLVPTTSELTLNGETISISPLRVGQMPAFLRVLAPVMKQITDEGVDWLSLFGERGEDLLRAVAIAINKPQKWVDDLAADEAILLAAKVIEVNADFFTRTVLPRLDGLFTQVGKVTSKDGSTPSKS